MGCYGRLINGTITEEAVNEAADLALTHGKEVSVGEEVSSLSTWHQKERALSEVLTEVADLALTHGSQWKQAVSLDEESDRRAA